MPHDIPLKSAPVAPREVPHTVSPSLWTLAWRRLKTDYVGMVSLSIVALFVLLMILSGFGLIAGDWSKEIGANYAPPSFLGADYEGGTPAAPGAPAVQEPPAAEYKSQIVDPIGDVIAELKGTKPPGSNRPLHPRPRKKASIRSPTSWRRSAAAKRRPKRQPKSARRRCRSAATNGGRDVLKKTIKGSETSIFVGIASAIVATFLGTAFGAFAGYYGRWVDDVFNWFYSVFSSIPYLLLVLAVAAVLQQKGVLTIILILGLTGWTGTFRLLRAEYLKHKSREYVQAADALGASNARRMFMHIFPNVSHVVLVQMSILVVAFIKSEVILSFLGFGVPVDVVSWGSMLNEAQNELILGKWWQLAAAGTAMAILVTAFALFTDALRDALDPKLKGRAGS
jgi:peptide/nickel transport system permease protein